MLFRLRWTYRKFNYENILTEWMGWDAKSEEIFFLVHLTDDTNYHYWLGAEVQKNNVISYFCTIPIKVECTTMHSVKYQANVKIAETNPGLMIWCAIKQLLDHLLTIFDF